MKATLAYMIVEDRGDWVDRVYYVVFKEERSFVEAWRAFEISKGTYYEPLRHFFLFLHIFFHSELSYSCHKSFVTY